MISSPFLSTSISFFISSTFLTTTIFITFISFIFFLFLFFFLFFIFLFISLFFFLFLFSFSFLSFSFLSFFLYFYFFLFSLIVPLFSILNYKKCNKIYFKVLNTNKGFQGRELGSEKLKFLLLTNKLVLLEEEELKGLKFVILKLLFILWFLISKLHNIVDYILLKELN